MNAVLTLVGSDLTDAIKLATGALFGAGEPQWLKDGYAVDIPCQTQTPRMAEEELRPILGDLTIDFLVQPLENRKKKLLVADMDSTMITSECIDEIAAYAGIQDKIVAITERAMRGELEFEDALRERVGLLKGLSESALQQAYDEKIRLTGGARELVQTMNANGAQTALISGGFTFFTARIADACGFHVNRANELLIDGGCLTGDVSDPILGREAKLSSLIEFRDAKGLGKEQTLAVGDGANDLAMIEEAGLGVAFHAKPIVAEAARASINHTDLCTLLYFQGYKEAEFVR